MKSIYIFLILSILIISSSVLAEEKQYNISLRKTHSSLPRENVIVLTYRGTDTYLMMTDLLKVSSQGKLENDLRELLSVGLVGEVTGYQNYFTDLNVYQSMTFEQLISIRQKHLTNFTGFAKSFGQYSKHLVESYQHLNSQNIFAQEAKDGVEELNRIMANSLLSGSTPEKEGGWNTSPELFEGFVSINVHARRVAQEQARLFSRNIFNSLKNFDYRAYGSNFTSLMELQANNRFLEADSKLDALHSRDFFVQTPIYKLVQNLFIATSESQGQNIPPGIKLIINQIGVIASENQSKLLPAVAGLLYVKSSIDLVDDIDQAAIVELVASEQTSTIIDNLARIQQIPAADVSSTVADLAKSLQNYL